MKIINSPNNPLIKELSQIKNRKLDKSLFLLEGLLLIETALKSKRIDINYVLITDDWLTKAKPLLSSLNDRQVISVSDEVIKKLSHSVSPQGIVASVRYKFSNLSDILFQGLPLLMVLDGINDPGNIGTIIRSAEAFGVDAVIILPNTCDVFSHKVIRATAGSLFHMPIIYCGYTDLSDYLNKHNISLIITEPHLGNPSWNMDFNRPLAIALGNEARGISKSIRDLKYESVSIFTTGNTESLNVAMAGSIILYEVFRQRNNKVIDFNYKLEIPYFK